jgi:aspartate kinase
MKVFKFGGASVKNAQAIRNMASIVADYSNQPLLVVVSAMGKTTNALERILQAKTGSERETEIQELKNYHYHVCEDLFGNAHPVFTKVDDVFGILHDQLLSTAEFDQVYDQVVSLGEVLSTLIVENYLATKGLSTQWLDAREYILTDKSFREGKVQWEETQNRISKLHPVLTKSIVVTQGFIGSTPDGLTTTLGREGSDYTAAIFASCLQASDVTIWKDVPGVMSADPKRLPGAVVFKELPYKEAAEMTYYGASVIHPKTIKPLALRGITLWVKSFDNPALPGTKIHECHIDQLPPLIVFKDNQCLISCKVTDYTFINEEQLGVIFHSLSGLDIHVNVMQNSAISFSFCIDFRESKVMALIHELQKHFEVYYNTNLTLITVKNYDVHTFEEYRKQPGVLIEQSSRSTLQVLIKPL